MSAGIGLVNGLAGLLIVTSLLVIGSARSGRAAACYALQSFVLVLLFATLAATFAAPQLFWWAGTAFVTKTVLVPLLIWRTVRGMDDAALAPRLPGTAWSILFAAAVVAVCYAVVASLRLPIADALKPTLAVSLAHFFLGLACVVVQRSLLKQVFGYCLMENGSHLTLALMANQAPELVEVGVATDAVFAVLVMVVLGARIHRVMGSLDVRTLTGLRG